MGKLLYEKETYKIRGACYDVYNEFGGGFKEKLIQNALVKDLKNKGFTVDVQKRIDIYYKGEKVGTYVPDIVVNGIILIELKVKPIITKEDEKQFWRYLKASDYKLGLLINFGTKKLQIKRRIYDKARSTK